MAAAALSPLPAAAQSRERFAAARAYHDQRGGTALAIMRNGVVWVETYARGASESTAAPLGAASKALGAILAAALADDNLLTLDEPVSLTLGAWGAHPLKSRITVRMLLDQTCGLQSGRAIAAAEALDLEPVAEPGARFIDDPAGMTIFAALARRKLENAGRTPPATYLAARALRPVGSQGVLAPTGPDGEVRLADGVFAPARALMRIGEIVRRDGVWRGDSLLSGAVLRQARQGSFVQPRYGFGFWIAAGQDSPSAALRGSDLWEIAPFAHDAVMAAGPNGLRLYVVPSRGLVAVRAARDAAPFSDAGFLRTMLADAPPLRTP